MISHRLQRASASLFASLFLAACGPTVTEYAPLRTDVANISVEAHNAMQSGNLSQAADLWRRAGERAAHYEANTSNYDPQLPKMRAIHNTNIAWINLLNGYTDIAKKQFSDAIDIARYSEDKEQSVRQAESDRTEILKFSATLGMAAYLAKSHSADGTPTFSPSQLASMVYMPKYDQVSMTRAFPGFFETDSVRFIVFPDAGWLRSVGKLISPRASFCTGFLMSRSVFITNAHCVTDESGNLVRGDYKVSFQRILGSETFGVSTITLHAQKWDRQRDTDWALLELDRANTLPYPFRGYAWDVDLSSLRLATAGYASDLNDGSWLGVHWDCRSLGSDTSTFSHKCRTWSGASGSPIFVIDGEWKGFVVGIHSAGTKTRDFDERVATGVLFTPEFRKSLKNLIDQGEARYGSQQTHKFTAY